MSEPFIGVAEEVAGTHIAFGCNSAGKMCFSGYGGAGSDGNNGAGGGGGYSGGGGACCDGGGGGSYVNPDLGSEAKAEATNDGKYGWIKVEFDRLE